MTKNLTQEEVVLQAIERNPLRDHTADEIAVQYNLTVTEVMTAIGALLAKRKLEQRSWKTSSGGTEIVYGLPEKKGKKAERFLVDANPAPAPVE